MDFLSSLFSPQSPAAGERRRINPYLHRDEGGYYNPLRHARLERGTEAFAALAAIEDGRQESVASAAVREQLREGGWLVDENADPSAEHYLRIVSLETNTVCNQACYFCPVSVDPRDDASMSDAMFDRIVGELTEYRDTLEGVFLQSYNEPTADARFVAHCIRLAEAGLPVAVLSNGSGLTPGRVDALLEKMQLRYLCINLSTLDKVRYQEERGKDHLQVVLRNLDALKDRPVAEQMKIVVLGRGDAAHSEDFENIRNRFAGSRFTVEHHMATDRAGQLETGVGAEDPSRPLRGCDLLGSRPIQHLHITPSGKCILCCQDYYENWIGGDLHRSSIREVLEGPEMARLRRWTYGVEEAPADFLCRTCVFAIRA